MYKSNDLIIIITQLSRAIFSDIEFMEFYKLLIAYMVDGGKDNLFSIIEFIEEYI